MSSLANPLNPPPPLWIGHCLGKSKPNFTWSLYGRGVIVCVNGLGLITKMATTPIYGENLKKILFSRTRSTMILKTQHEALGHLAVQISS